MLTEESLRKNFVLVYELLDEMVDYGYGQSTSTEALKASVFNDPVTPPQPRACWLSRVSPTARLSDTCMAFSCAVAQLLRPGTLSGDARAPPSAMLRSVLSTGDARRGGAAGGGPMAGQGGASGGGSGRSEIFVDIIERLTVTFNGAGYMLTSELDGAIQCKSFLAGNPQIKMALNEDLAVTAASSMPYDDRAAAAAAVGGLCFLDDVAFHERVSLDEFESDRTLLLTPPAGEFTVMNYRSSAPFKAPFRVTPSISEPAPYKLEVTVHVRTEFPGANAAVGVTLRVPLPKSTSHVSLSMGDSADISRFGSAEFDEAKKELVWTLKRFPGGQERSIKCKCTLTTERVASIKKEVGPVALSFTLPNFHVSGLNVRYLQIQAKSRLGGAEPPARWVRYVTTSSSYVCRL